MQNFVFEFDNESDLRETSRKLMNEMEVTGEVNIKPLGDGRWRMEVNSERDLRESTLEKLKGYRPDLGPAGARRTKEMAAEQAAASAETTEADETAEE